MLDAINDGERYELTTPVDMPDAAGFLWNRRMMIQANCRGYAVARFMQPEPAQYAYAPTLEAKTFMQPEQPYYAHHPGRFCYIKDEASGELFSAPYEPVRARLDHYRFSVGEHDIRWRVEHLGIRVEMTLGLPREDVVELWSIRVVNLSGRPRELSIYPYFPVGYMSWMNQSGRYEPGLGAVVCSCVTPYQKYPDYFKNRDFKDKTYFLHERTPDAWEVNQRAFEGEGGLHHPTGVSRDRLACGDALYETPAAVLQYRVRLTDGASENYRFLFGPARDHDEIERIRDRYLSATAFADTAEDYAAYIASGRGCLAIETPDPQLNRFVNRWLPRQVFYHGDVNRLSTDPQTRNYLQDNMGMSYIDPAVTRDAFLLALGQQETSGAMPDGILLMEGAELKYINQVPHTDHCVWLPVCLKAYLDETDDRALLNEVLPYSDGDTTATLFDHVTLAMRWLLQARDPRGLSYIAQGDWCDPMNMVGYKGRGVSGWLSVATAYALNLWADICAREGRAALAREFRAGADEINDCVNRHLWDGDWYGRGITDDGIVFGVRDDPEGRIFLNPQSWSILSGAPDPEQTAAMLRAVTEQLETPYGVMMLAPAYTGMRDDVGRVTQKFPGSGENGSVYNHAAAFYVFSLYSIGEADRAYDLMRRMIPGPDRDDYLRRGQMPVFIPNYYRGAYHQHPRTAGRSSQLFNTGTPAWVYRCLVEGLFGLRGEGDGLRVAPQLPAHWDRASVTRRFRGATFRVTYRRSGDVEAPVVAVNGEVIEDGLVRGFQPGDDWDLVVTLAR